jgi:hypothetical protein
VAYNSIVLKTQLIINSKDPQKVGTNFADNRWSLGRYTSLADSGHGVCVVCIGSSIDRSEMGTDSGAMNPTSILNYAGFLGRSSSQGLYLCRATEHGNSVQALLIKLQLMLDYLCTNLHSKGNKPTRRKFKLVR